MSNTHNTAVRRVVRLQARPGRAADMRRHLVTLRAETLKEPGCAEFGFYQSITDEEKFLLVEDFASQAALDAHMAAPHTRAFFALDVMVGGQPISGEWLS